MDLRSQISVVRHWAWLLVICALGAGALAYFLSQSQPKVYEAEATLVVGPSLTASNPDYGQLLAAQVLAQTFAEVATTRPLLERVASREQLSISAEEFQRRVFAVAPRDSTLISIIAQAGDPDVAARIANGIADELVKVSRPIDANEEAAQAFIDRQVVAIQQEILALTDEITRLRAESSGSAGTQRLDDLDGRLVSLRGAYAALVALSSDSASNLLTVIEPAIAPEQPSAPRILVNTTLAAAAGILIALVLIFVRENLRVTTRRVADEQAMSGAAGVIPTGREP